MSDHTSIGLQRALVALKTYNAKNDLVANPSKTKVMVFGKRCSKSSKKWVLGSHKIDPVRTYNYLGA